MGRHSTTYRALGVVLAALILAATVIAVDATAQPSLRAVGSNAAWLTGGHTVALPSDAPRQSWRAHAPAGLRIQMAELPRASQSRGAVAPSVALVTTGVAFAAPLRI